MSVSLILNYSLPRENAKKPDPIKVPRTAVTPHPCNFLCVPCNFVATAVAWVKAQTNRDTEAKIDAGLRIAAAPLSFIQKIQNFLTFFLRFCAIVGIHFKQFHIPGGLTLWILPAAILGTILCAIESIYEGISLERACSLLSHIPKTNDPKEVLVGFQYLHDEYFSVSQKEETDIRKMIEKRYPKLTALEKLNKCKEYKDSLLSVKKDNLARRVRPWLVQEIEGKMKPILKDLKNEDPVMRAKASRQAVGIFNEIKVQCHKKILVHALGLLALILCALGFLLPFIACPILLPVVLLAVGTVLSTVVYFIENGYQDQKGWNFSISDCIPSWIKWIFNEVF